ncbi:hypothetical protein [uncultured Dokdonia sp.]|uniref:hypothetical protein n=1 Tax=uncultured Dokdonia sp. TaxID=575653 RepID=UPI00260C07C3|nr:hypothetical protein [uncultured Dokdonia sp.]
MCSINFAVVPESTVDPITKINGRYRLSGQVNWIDFPVTISNPQTPNIPLIGTYDMGIQIVTAGGTSEWFDTIAAFTVARICPRDSGEGGDGGPIDIGDVPIGDDPIGDGGGPIGGGGGGDVVEITDASDEQVDAR